MKTRDETTKIIMKEMDKEFCNTSSAESDYSFYSKLQLQMYLLCIDVRLEQHQNDFGYISVMAFHNILIKAYRKYIDGLKIVESSMTHYSTLNDKEIDDSIKDIISDVFANTVVKCYPDNKDRLLKIISEKTPDDYNNNTDMNRYEVLNYKALIQLIMKKELNALSNGFDHIIYAMYFTFFCI